MSAAPADSVATCDLCDAHKNDSSGAFRVLSPVFRDFGGRAAFAGPVTTVKCFEDNTSVKAAVESPGHGRVLVVDGAGSLRRALLGGNLGAPGLVDVPVLIQGVWVRPGDRLVADADGIVVLPGA